MNRLFLNSKIRALPAITIENHAKFEKNNQLHGVMYDNTYQPKETLSTIAMINKIVYTKSIGNWTFSPGVKFRFYKKDRSEIARPGDYHTNRIPLFMLKYAISDRTDIMLGLQGIPGFEYKFKDYVQTENDFNQKIYALQIQNRSTYFGYTIWASTGIKFDELQYLEKKRDFENYKSSSTYIRVLLGW